jgi:hypothetical protein
VVVAAARATLWRRIQDYDAGRRTAAEVDGWFRAAQLTNAWGAVTAAATVLLVVVTYRQAKNHEWFGRPATRFGSGWAIAAWLIPGVQAVLPALLFAQLWRGSDPANKPDDPDWRRRRASPLIWLWLALNLVTVAVLIVTFVDSIDRFVHLIDAPYDESTVFGARFFAARPWLAWSAGITGAVGHLLAAHLVNQIVTRQQGLRADRSDRAAFLSRPTAVRVSRTPPARPTDCGWSPRAMDGAEQPPIDPWGSRA